MRKAEIKIHDQTAGWLSQDEEGYHFSYDATLCSNHASRQSPTQHLSYLLNLYGIIIAIKNHSFIPSIRQLTN